MAGMGFWFMRRNRTSDAYFKAGGKLPWWVVSLSIHATMFSSITFLSGAAKFQKLARGEFDRRFTRMPKLVIHVVDGGKWIHSVHENECPFAVEILDIYHATEHLKPLMLGLGIKEGSKRWKQLNKYWSDRIAAGKIESILESLWKGKYGKAIGHDLVAERIEGTARHSHVLQVQPPRGVLQLSRRRTIAGDLCGMSRA